MGECIRIGFDRGLHSPACSIEIELWSYDSDRMVQFRIEQFVGMESIARVKSRKMPLGQMIRLLGGNSRFFNSIRDQAAIRDSLKFVKRWAYEVRGRWSLEDQGKSSHG